MKLLKVDTLEEAREKLLSAAKPPQTERVPFAQSIGRILGQDITAADNVPDFRKSTVDGYAVRAADTQGVTESIPVFLDIIEDIRMGTAPEKQVGPGQASYVPTGGMLPDGADAVVMIEHCEKFDDNSIAVYDAVSAGRNVIAEGEDICKGQVFLKKGIRIRAQEIGVLSAAGIETVTVFKPWRATVISTGDELVPTDAEPQKGQIRDINTYSLSAAAAQSGFQVVASKVLPDDRDVLRKAIKEAMETSEVVIVSGGSSQGEKDYTASIFDQLAEPGVFTHGIALKPGKPTILGYDEPGSTLLMGLPGHPAAALMVFELIGSWIYRKLTGQKASPCVTAVLSENVAAAGGRATCFPVELKMEGSSGIFNAYKAVPIHGKSGVLTTMTKADGYIIIPAGHEGMEAGQQVQVIMFER